MCKAFIPTSTLGVCVCVRLAVPAANNYINMMFKSKSCCKLILQKTKFEPQRDRLTATKIRSLRILSAKNQPDKPQERSDFSR